jgi:hypothetical protein
VKFFKDEKAFTRWVLHEARARDWQAWHLESMQTVRTPEGWRSLGAPNARGFPDLVLAHPGHGVVFAELKLAERKATPEQLEALFALRAAGAAGARAFLWRGSDSSEICDLLDGRPSSARLFQEIA